MRFKTIIIVSLFAVAVAGCGGSFDRNIESRVTISQGVYGQTVSYDDAAPVSHDYLTGNLKVFTAPRNDSPAVAETTSDDHGFYEVELAPGDYEICINGNLCHAFTVAAQSRVRLDYQSFEPGWWEGQIPN